MGIGIWTIGNSDNLLSNKVSWATAGIIVSATNNDVEHNLLFNINNGGSAISFNCTGSGNTVVHNVVNDAYYGIIDLHGSNTIAPNTFTNVQKLSSGSC